MQADDEAIVLKIVPVSIHQDQYYDIIFYYENDPNRTPRSCRLSPETIPPGLKEGTRVRVKAMLSTILGLESISE